MAVQAVRSLSGNFYSTNLNPQVATYDRLVDRISWSLGHPLINLEIHKNQLYEYISIAAEMFTKYAGYTTEHLIFDSNLYTNGKGIRLDRLFSITPDLADTTLTVDAEKRVKQTRSTIVSLSANVTTVAYHYDVSDSSPDPVEFILRVNDGATKHQKVSKMLVATQYDENDSGGNATYTEYGSIYTSSADFATWTVTMTGASSTELVLSVNSTVSGDATVVALDTFDTSIATTTQDQSALASYDSLLNDYRKVVDVFVFEEGSTTGVNTLFTIEQTLAQQTYFSYAMGNYGFDLISWYVVKEFLDVREKMLSQRRQIRFNPRTQYLTMYPGPLSGDTARFYGIIGCYVEKPLSDVIKEPWVYQYALALTKIGIGHVRGKYSGTNLFGGGSLNAELLADGKEEKDKLETQLYEGVPGFGDADPPLFFIG